MAQFFSLVKLTPAAAAAKSLQSCPTLCDPIDGSPPGFPVPGILQARTLEWVAISFSNAWKWKVKVKSLSCVWLLATRWTAAYQAPLCPWDFPSKSTGVGCHCLLWKLTPVIPKPSFTLESLGKLNSFFFFFLNATNLYLYPWKFSFIRSGEKPKNLCFY